MSEYEVSSYQRMLLLMDLWLIWLNAYRSVAYSIPQEQKGQRTRQRWSRSYW